ncbi:MAG: hypothetical protein LQ341_005540, partial [Variospora aurantia]
RSSATKEQVPSPPPSPKAPASTFPHPDWELVHGFYVLMGGFTLACGAKEGSFLPCDLTQATLTPDGLRFLLQLDPDALPDITANQIRDKSKADGLKKTIVCAQALWFCVQCITRLSQSLPVGLLELNTVGHALCTLAIYIFWWEKPLDIEEPTVIRNERLDPLLAYMWMSSRASARHYYDHDMPHGLQDEFHCIWPFTPPALDDLNPRNAALLNPALSHMEGRTRPHYISLTLKLKRKIHFLLRPSSPPRLTPAGLGTRRTAISHLSHTDLLRWDLASHAIHRYDLSADLHARHRIATSDRLYNARLNIHFSFFDTLDTRLNPRLQLRAPNAALSVAPSGILPGFALSGALYGGLHLAAWTAPFTSPSERVLWHVAATSVTVTGAVFGALALVLKTRWAQRSLSDAVKSMTTREPLTNQAVGAVGKFRSHATAIIAALGFCVVAPCLPFAWFLYLFSRVYLVVASLKDMAFLPAGAFETPVWPGYLPHIT